MGTGISLNRIREDVLSHLQEELPTQTVKNWFASAHWELKEEDQLTVVLAVPHSFHRSQIMDHHQSALLPALQKATEQSVEVRVSVDDSIDAREGEGAKSADGGNAHREEKGSSGGPSRDSRDSVHQVGQGPRGDGAPSGTTGVGLSGDEEQKRSRQAQKSDKAHAGPSSPSSGTVVEASSTPSTSPSSTGSAVSSPERSAPGTRQGEDPPDEFHRSQVKKELRDRYTFDSFVEGDSNTLARSAAKAVASEPGGTNFNPLLIYGGVGLGKTHLAQAIANSAVAQETADYLCYESSESFTSTFVRAIREGDGDQFSRKYREVDLLILDDVQFFEGKEKTQEEFFHLFNALHQRGKQIVLCADRPPKEIDGIEERLLSRFDWGLSADIQQPTYETRLAILHRKADTLGLEVAHEVLELMAQSITKNIRQLEGALKQISARAELIDDQIDVSTARQLLKGQVDLSGPSPPDPKEIINAVVQYYGVAQDDVIARSRKQEIVRARHVAMYLCRSLTNMSLSKIGNRFAGRDHSTISHACTKIGDLLDVEKSLEREIEEIQREIRSRRM